MIVYSATLGEFRADVMSNGIGDIIAETYRASTGYSTGRSEFNSWQNSLQYIDRVLSDDQIPQDAGVAIEYHLPQSSKRIDFILTGKDQEKKDSALLIELKQWQEAGLTHKDGVVTTRFQHGVKETAHPSYQVWSYKCLLEDYNQTVQQEEIQLIPCAYLHNYEQDDVITNELYSEYTSKAPVFLKSDAIKLREFIKEHVKYGDKDKIMYRIDHGKIKPSKNLADQLSSMLQGNDEFVLIDDQKVAYETALQAMKKAENNGKQVLIIQGGPGTGKSVLAINLLVELTHREFVAQYVTRNSAPREVYKSKLTGSFTRSRIDSMFSGSGAFLKSPANIFDCLIVDEAHRLNAKSGMFNHLGENQIKEIINASKLSVFFVDEDQKVTLKDIGDSEEIRHWASRAGAEITELKLESQFRCNGSDGYLAWLDDALQVHKTANENLEGIDYDFKVVDNPQELHRMIIEKNGPSNKARMLAGYCWEWISKNRPILKDIEIGEYRATWNLAEDGQGWIAKPHSVTEVGCIHTSQGLEVEYAGVIIGPDLIVRNGKVITDVSKRARTDNSVKGWKGMMKRDPEEAQRKLDAIIKNTYRTLMTRGQKGCYIYCTDEETAEYFRNIPGVGISMTIGN